MAQLTADKSIEPFACARWRSFSRVKVPKSPGSGKNFAKGKGVRCEAESEESRIFGIERLP